ncbi:MAG TPA: glycosyltransferase [Methyloceanibacter sp.]|nr:glycosyltransferase [Methyloceanibacter sp.]
MLASAEDRRLLVVTESLGYGGTESHLLAVLPRIAKAGWQIAVFCLTERGERAAELEKAGVRVLAPRKLASRHQRRLLFPIQAGIAGSQLYALARRWRPHIAHFFLPAPYIIGTPVAVAARVPVKIMSRRSLAHYQRNWPGARRLESLLHTRMTAITGNCGAIMRELVAEGVPESKLRLIYNGIDPDGVMPGRSEARAALGLDADAFIGVMVANLIPYKGHRDLIQALAMAAPRLPASWQVLCVGRDEGPRSELEALAAAKGLGANIRFLGQRSDVDRVLAAADFGVLPPRENEGFSNAILESMRAGLPMAVTDIGGNAEAVIDGETGFVVQPCDPSALSSAILRLAQDPALRRALGNAGRQRVTATFTLDDCVAQYCKLYGDLIEPSPKRLVASQPILSR